MGETALITGSSMGIGLAVAHKYAQNGYNVVLNAGSDESALNASVAELRAENPHVTGIMADVSDYEQVRAMFSAIPTDFGPITVLVNNAGIAHVGLFTDMTPNQWRRIIDVNLLSVFNCCHAALPDMLRAKRGTVVNISSMWGVTGASCEAVYAASKGAVNSFTKSLAKELAPSGIRVNAVACGAIDTRMNAFLTPGERADLEDAIPMGRFGLAKEIADVVFFLTSPGSGYITGQIITADGGLC